MNNPTYHLGIARVSLQLLTDILRLPEGHEVIGVRAKRDAVGGEYEFEVLIDGPLMPETGADEITPRVRIMCSVDIGEPELSRKITCSFEPEVLAVFQVDPEKGQIVGSKQYPHACRDGSGSPIWNPSRV